MNENRNKAKGIIGTIIFHIIALFAIFFLALSTPLPLPGEEGVEVNLGYDDVGMGRIQHEEPAPQQEIKPPPPPPPEEEKVEEEIITQDIEEAPAIEEKKEEKKEEEVKQEETIEQPEPQPEETTIDKEPEPQPEPPKVDPRALYKGKSKTGTGQDEGETGQPGDQGNPNGDPNISNHYGLGGAGNGIGYDLGGRGAKHLSEPQYTSQEQGKIVVNIRVNREGKVVGATIGKGTNITDQKLQNLTIQAALRSVFQPDPNATEVQKGTITYNFLRIH